VGPFIYPHHCLFKLKPIVTGLGKGQHYNQDSIAGSNKDYFPTVLMVCCLPLSSRIAVDGNLFSRVQFQSRETGHSHPFSVEVMNAWFSTSRLISLLSMVFIAAQKLL
jgi:hypothetical protein